MKTKSLTLISVFGQYTMFNIHQIAAAALSKTLSVACLLMMLCLDGSCSKYVVKVGKFGVDDEEPCS